MYFGMPLIAEKTTFMLIHSYSSKELWKLAAEARLSGDPAEHILGKYPLIVITNVCNLSCGGCSQLCGQFKKEQLWFITLDELRRSIEVLGEHSFVGIFGGEPTLHPEFEAIVELLYEYPKHRFMVFTNGRIPVIDCKNVTYNVDPKPGNQYHYPVLIAAQDVLGIEDRGYYWDKAQKDCYFWKKCGVGIYRNKAYFCEVAGAIDQLANEDHGWEDGNPFNKTNEEIAEQASHFCYRCGMCASNGRKSMPDGIPLQKLEGPYLVSEINKDLVSKPHLNELVQLELPRATS